TLAVIDRHTGTARSPASLSGGETFYTSLALALGLADVVRAEAGGVDLDTLFIDEGFGSLDTGTLDEVMAVIDDLRDRGRVVGIVSHVADLKDRVPERLEVRRLPDGSSAVTIVAQRPAPASRPPAVRRAGRERQAVSDGARGHRAAVAPRVTLAGGSRHGRSWIRA